MYDSFSLVLMACCINKVPVGGVAQLVGVGRSTSNQHSYILSKVSLERM